MKNTIAIITADSLWDAKLLAHFSAFSHGSENRTYFRYSWHFCYPSKQNEFLSEKLEINPRRKFLFQKWDFVFPLHLMVQYSTNDFSLFLPTSISWVSLNTQLHFLQVFRNPGDWRVIRLFHKSILEGLFVQAWWRCCLAEMKFCTVIMGDTNSSIWWLGVQ